MSWTRVDSKKPATKDWKQVLVILQTYQNLGNAQIAGEFQTIDIAMYHPEYGFCINGKSKTNITHWQDIPKFPTPLIKKHTIDFSIEECIYMPNNKNAITIKIKG